VLLPPRPTAGIDPVWHLYVIRTGARDLLREALARKGVQALIHYPTPPHRQPCYAGERWPELPLTEGIASEVLSLPMGPHLSVAQVEQVADALHAVLPETVDETQRAPRQRAVAP
jgi:dTDP-3-amino-3,4,6-trideoxy-alpha-D-glucose transaminase